LSGVEFRDTRNEFFFYLLDNNEQMSENIADLFLAIARSGMRIPFAISSASAKDRLEFGLERLLPNGLWKKLFDVVMCVDDFEQEGYGTYTNKGVLNKVVFKKLSKKFKHIVIPHQIIMFEDTKGPAKTACEENGFYVIYVGDDDIEVNEDDFKLFHVKREQMVDHFYSFVEKIES